MVSVVFSGVRASIAAESSRSRESSIPTEPWPNERSRKRQPARTCHPRSARPLHSETPATRTRSPSIVDMESERPSPTPYGSPSTTARRCAGGTASAPSTSTESDTPVLALRASLRLSPAVLRAPRLASRLLAAASATASSASCGPYSRMTPPALSFSLPIWVSTTGAEAAAGTAATSALISANASSMISCRFSSNVGIESACWTSPACSS